VPIRHADPRIHSDDLGRYDTARSVLGPLEGIPGQIIVQPRERSPRTVPPRVGPLIESGEDARELPRRRPNIVGEPDDRPRVIDPEQGMKLLVGSVPP
jgi:hypothetical protein